MGGLHRQAVGVPTGTWGILALDVRSATWTSSVEVPRLLPTDAEKPGLILIVAWIAQTFIQLVLLSIIMVGQDVQSIAADARSENTFKDTQAILDAMDTETEGGLRTILEAIQAQAKPVQQS
jgi:hypothetical protein